MRDVRISNQEAMEAASFAEASAWDRPIGDLQFFQNELLQVDVSLPPACPMSLEDRAGNGIDDGFRDGTHDLGRKRPEIFPCFRAERNRSITWITRRSLRSETARMPHDGALDFIASSFCPARAERLVNATPHEESKPSPGMRETQRPVRCRAVGR